MLHAPRNTFKKNNSFLMQKLPLAIDVSKATLDYHTLDQQSDETKGVFKNKVEDIAEFLSAYDPTKYFIVAEPTGTYSDKLLEVAYRMDFEIRLVNPKKSSQYSDVLGILHKTDTSAAFVLFEMGRNKNLEIPLYVPCSQVLKERKQVQMALNALSKQERKLKNQIHALEQCVNYSEIAMSAYQTILASLQEQKKELEKQLQQLSDAEIKEFKRYAESVVGIGPKTCTLLMVYTNGLKYFDHKTQLPKFVGIVPSSHRSGTSVNKKGHITKSGPGDLRACLYSAANSAKRYNHACKAIYERLRAKGKCHKLAMMAVMNKLLHQIFAVVKSKTVFDNNLYLNKAA